MVERHFHTVVVNGSNPFIGTNKWEVGLGVAIF